MKCLCIKYYDVELDFGMIFYKGEIYEYKKINSSLSNPAIFILYQQNDRLSSGYSTLTFNKKGFKRFFIDLNKVRRIKLNKIKKSL